jgi:DHA2 family multidrug resistance protein-like MFS transporter
MEVDRHDATRREWLGLAVIALPCLLYSMDLTVLDLAVPAIAADLRPSSSELLWIIDVYGFVLAGALIPMGSLGDRIGRRRLLVTGAAAFGLMSVLAALAVNTHQLIAARAALGLAGATLAPSTLSLIRSMFRKPSERTVAVGIWMSSFSLGAAMGPLIGGALLEHFRWGAVFLVRVPVMLMLLLLAPRLLPEFRDPAAGPIDLVSAAWSLGSVLMVIFGIKRIAQEGVAPISVASIVAGLSLGALFVRRQRTSSHPLVDVRLFAVPAFSAAFVAYMLSTAVAFGTFVLIAQYMQWVLELSPLRAGMWITPFTMAFILGAQVTPIIRRRSQPAFVMTAGLALSAVGFGLLARIETSSGVSLLVTAMIVFALGLAPVSTLATDLMMATASTERAGAAAALSETGSELGGALGIAILGSIGTAFYRHAMSRTVLDMPVKSLREAQDTLGTALSVAKELPTDIGLELAQAARDAFVSSFRLACAVAAFVAVALAVLVALWLKPTSTERSPLGLLSATEKRE